MTSVKGGNEAAKRPRRKAEQSEATRAAVLKIARELFTERGYGGTFTDDVAVAVGVSRGALYYHFGDKKGLFRAVAEQMAEELGQQVLAALEQSDAETHWSQLMLAADASLDAFQDPSVRRILLVDAPSVLGWKEWRALEEQYHLGFVARKLRAAVSSGELERLPVVPLAHLVLAVVIEAALLSAHSSDAEEVRRQAGTCVMKMLDGLHRSAGDGDR